MFTVLYKLPGGNYGEVVKTVYAVDRATESFLVTDWWDNFAWIPMSECKLYIPEDEGD